MGRRAFSRSAIMRRLFNTPLAVTPDTATVVLGAIGERFDVAQLVVAADGERLTIRDLESRAADARAAISARGAVDRVAPMLSANRLMFVHQGVAHVDVRGELVAENDGSIGPSSGFTSYDGIRAQVLAADADPEVLGILVDIDCAGGEVADLFECVAALTARRGTKPMRAIIRGVGASAAYAIAACADEITINELGYAGSIGVITMHADFSRKLEQDGVAVTIIASGSHKSDGNPYEPLPEAVAARMQRDVNTANDRFVAHVAASRGLDEQAVREQQAALYHGADAVTAGLVDKVMSWADSTAEFVASVNTPASVGTGGASGRSARPARGARSNQENNMDPITPEAHDAALATARTEAVAQERSRFAALAELDGASSISEPLAAAIAAGTSAGDFAIALHKGEREKASAALAGASADAAKPGQLPAKSAEQPGGKVNRGAALIERMRGKHPGLPAQG